MKIALKSEARRDVKVVATTFGATVIVPFRAEIRKVIMPCPNGHGSARHKISFTSGSETVMPLIIVLKSSLIFMDWDAKVIFGGSFTAFMLTSKYCTRIFGALGIPLKFDKSFDVTLRVSFP